MNWTSGWRRLWLATNSIFAALVLVACGGGGGGGGGGSSPPPPPPPPPSVQLAITDDLGPDVALIATALIEGTLQMTDLVAQMMLAMATSGEVEFSADCRNGGRIDYVLTDNDQDGALTPGDSIRATLPSTLAVNWPSAVVRSQSPFATVATAAPVSSRRSTKSSNSRMSR